MRACIVFACFGLQLCAVSAAADDDADATNSLGNMMKQSSVQLAPEMTALDSAGEIIKGLEHIPAPGKVFARKIDPVSQSLNSCDRDYEKALCPKGWLSIGPVKGGTVEYCAAGSQYQGPCQDDVKSFVEMSAAAKRRWSEQCKAYFPCKGCRRSYRALCPETWEHVGGLMCKPPSDYKGHCKGVANFAGHNAAMLEQWSDQCSAYWACQQSALRMSAQDYQYPVSTDATLARIAKSLQ